MDEISNLTPQSQRASSFLEGAVFPAGKSELVAHASLQGAPEEVLEILDRLPDISYGSLNKVIDEINSASAKGL